jgi:poly-gamma-glutamate synthesis protein (capsule biosynthesis protein)
LSERKKTTQFVEDARGASAAMQSANADGTASGTRLFLCGDVMTGRGIDQIFAQAAPPHLFEPCVRSAAAYVELAERANGPIPRRAGFAYVWGDALQELARMHPDACIVNLETAVTTCEDAWPGKGIHYRMHPANVGVLEAAGIGCCVLANNHVLDWGYAGLAETLTTLRDAGLAVAGAGRDAREAAAPAVIGLAGDRRVLVFAFASQDSGVPKAWAAGSRGGVNLLNDLSPRTIEAVASQIGGCKRSGDLTVLSIHWGENWGYPISEAQRRFAHALVDDAGVDIVHGHSSHHVKGVEVHAGRLILYGCGDFLNDYEGIGGYDAFRSDLALMYFPALESSGALLNLTMVPTCTRRFRVNRAGRQEAQWLERLLTREGRELGTRAMLQPDGTLELEWK